MREIEVKYQVRDPEALLVALKERGVRLSDPVVQDDQAYAPASWQFGDSKIGVSFLRLRTMDDRHYFTLKHVVHNEQACLEHETQVADRVAMHRAVLHMGYRPTVRIVKTRRTAELGSCSLCLDDVRDLGTFVELERIAADDCDAAGVQDDLAAVAAGLGITAGRVLDTYDSLIHRR